VGVVNKSEEAGVRTAEPSRSHGQDVGGVPTSLSLEIFFLFLFLFLLSSCRKSSFGRLYKQANDAILPLRYSNDTVLVYGAMVRGTTTRSKEFPKEVVVTRGHVGLITKQNVLSRNYEIIT